MISLRYFQDWPSKGSKDKNHTSLGFATRLDAKGTSSKNILANDGLNGDESHGIPIHSKNRLPQQIQVTPISRIITLVKAVYKAIYTVIYHGTIRKNSPTKQIPAIHNISWDATLVPGCEEILVTTRHSTHFWAQVILINLHLSLTSLDGLRRYITLCLQKPFIRLFVPWSKVAILGMAIPPLIGILVMGI